MPVEPIAEDVRAEVLARLARIEAEEDVRVFLAVESGSRAWGFASRDSDYDVRFLYAHPPAWYLSINVERRRDVIERPIVDEMDVSGWDLRKALGLLHRSNPPLLEWLNSPLIYRQQEDVADELRALVPAHYHPHAALHHYLHMARGNFRDYMQGPVVWRKKYFYVLRPLLAIRWIEAGRGPVPMEFSDLVDAMVDDPALRDAIDRLTELKRAGDEMDRGPRIEPISLFIEAEMERLTTLHGGERVEKPDADSLDVFLRRALTLIWPGTPALP